MVRRLAAVFGLALCLLWLCPVTAFGEADEQAATDAAETDVEATARAEWADFLSGLPEEVTNLLPAGFSDADPAVSDAAVKEAVTLPGLLNMIGTFFGANIGKNVSLLARICGMLVLVALFRALSGGASPALEHALSLCSVLAITGLLLTGGAADVRTLGAYFQTVEGVCLSLLPLMGTLYAMGGNVGAAVANHAVMSAFLTVLETVCGATVLPVAGLCLALALMDAAHDGISLAPLTSLIHKTYTRVFSFLMLLLCGVLGLQHTLARGSDTLALRTVRFAAGSFLPVVGSSISEALSTVAGSVQYLRGTVGVGGIAVMICLFLPMFLSVCLTRLTLSLSAAAAGLLGCAREEKFLGASAGVFGYLSAVIAALFVMVVFSLTLLARCATGVT